MNTAARPPLLLDRHDAVLFDLDGTLVDTIGDFADAIALVLAERGHPRLPDDAVLPLVGKGGGWLVEQVLARVEGGPPTAADAAQALERFRRHYAAVNGTRARLFPGVREGVAVCAARGLRLGCVTNKPTDAARALLARLGLADAFAVINGGDRHGLKPDPAPILGSARDLGVAPARTLVVGDSVNDAAAARGAGCALVIVTYGYNHGEPATGIPADAHLDSLADLAGLVAPAPRSAGRREAAPPPS